MPKLLKPSQAPAPDAQTAALRKALAALLRRLGLIGKDAPDDKRLCELAIEYAEYRFSIPEATLGPAETPLSPPDKKIDEDLPF
jgi:hypothetical protein